MRLFHYTSRQHLRGIAVHGLTVGDVPTDFARNRGVVGIWLTTQPSPGSLGLGGSRTNKKAIRLAVDLEDRPPLYRWSTWASEHVTAATRESLHSTAPTSDTWFIFLGILKPERIVECVDTGTGQAVEAWRDLPPTPSDAPGVAPFGRAKWHKHLLAQVAARLAQS